MIASRFWVGGTGTWDAADTTHWSASSGGAGGASVPGSGDTVTFNGASGGGTVTLNFGGTITIQSISLGAFTGTWDNSANNNNMTFSSNVAFDGSGSGTRTINLGSATYTLTAGPAVWSFGTVTGLTFSGASSTIVFSGATGQAQFTGGGLTYGTVSFGPCSGTGFYLVSGSNTIGTLNLTAPLWIRFPSTTTISNAFTLVGSSTNQFLITSSSPGTTATVNAAASSTVQWATLRDMTFTNSPVATNSFSGGNNNGITITAPSAGGGGGASGVIG